MTQDFGKVVSVLEAEPGVTRARMFGSEGLKVGSSVFAMEVKGKLVVKVSKRRADELRAQGVGASFDPGHGRVMKQWLSVSPKAKTDWLTLAREALEYVREIS